MYEWLLSIPSSIDVLPTLSVVLGGTEGLSPVKKTYLPYTIFILFYESL